MAVYIEHPSQTEDARQLFSYLYQLTDTLNAALNNLTEENFRDGSAAKVIVSGGDTEEQSTTKTQQYNRLRSLIIKTADTVNASMDELRGTLESDYVAQSTFGEYREQARMEMRETAQGELRTYRYSSTAKTLEEGMTEFSAYVVETEQYIKTGVLGFDENEAPIYGIAVGKDLYEVTETRGGVEYRVIGNKAAAWFTATELVFFNEGARIAWMTGQELQITRTNIRQSIRLGGVTGNVDAATGQVIWSKG